MFFYFYDVYEVELGRSFWVEFFGWCGCFLWQNTAMWLTHKGAETKPAIGRR